MIARAPSASAVAGALSHVYDPELGIDVVALGLIYGIDAGANAVTVQMALTSAGCPMGAIMLEMAGEALHARFPDCSVSVEQAAEPPWDVAMADARALQQLGLGPAPGA